MFCVLVVLVTWLNDDGDQGAVLLPGGVGHLQLEGVVSLLHGGQLQGGRAHPLDTERSRSKVNVQLSFNQMLLFSTE